MSYIPGKEYLFDSDNSGTFVGQTKNNLIFRPVMGNDYDAADGLIGFHLELMGKPFELVENEAKQYTEARWWHFVKLRAIRKRLKELI